MKCELCSREFESLKALGLHLTYSHKNISHKDYYDTYLKTSSDGICPVCGKPTKWKGGLHGYARTCSMSCGQKHPETITKMSQTNLERYGATNPYGSQQIRNKIKETNKIKYGVENAFSIPSIHEKALLHSLASHNDNGNHSSWETLLENGLKDKNINYIKQYNKDIRYPFYCDFYLPDNDMFIEINGFWMHGGHIFNENNPKDIEILNNWKSKSNYNNMYKSAITVWTVSDPNKLTHALKNNLNYIILWTLDDINNFLNSL